MPVAGAAFRSIEIMAGFFSISRESSHDRLRHRGREEERLPLRRQMLQHAADVGEEAHVQHPVRFVEDEDLQPVELRVADTGNDRAGVPAWRRARPRRCGRRAPAAPCRRRRRWPRRRAACARRGRADARRSARPARASASGSARASCRASCRISRWRIGSRNAAVLPLPVIAAARTSLPAIAGGMASV